MKMKSLIKESSLSRIFQHIEDADSSFGVISASRIEFSDKENAERYLELKKAVRKMGLGFIELKGGYQEESGFTEESSLFIPGISRNQAVELGKKYDQYSVLYKDKDEFIEIGTNMNSGIGEILKRFIKSSGKSNYDFNVKILKDFFSSLLKGSHRGRKFLFRLQERESPSFNRMAYHRDEPLKWYTVYEEINE